MKIILKFPRNFNKNFLYYTKTFGKFFENDSRIFQNICRFWTKFLQRLNVAKISKIASNFGVGLLVITKNIFICEQVFGTPEYIAPEVILRQGYGKPVDWWSMGIILYEFLIGCVPFFGETPEELFAHTVNDDVEWPNDEDLPIKCEAKDLISALLQQNPRDRLGTGGAQEVKEHPYFANVDWDSLLRQKAEFVPQLNGEEDTSYFDSRVDRYKPDLLEETDDSEESFLFGSFSSCSAHFRRVTSRQTSYNSDASDKKTDSSFEEHSSNVAIEEACGVRALFDENERRASSTCSTITATSSSSCTYSSSSTAVHRTNVSVITANTTTNTTAATTTSSSLMTNKISVESRSSAQMAISSTREDNVSVSPSLAQLKGSDLSPSSSKDRKKTYFMRNSVPKFSISMDDETSSCTNEQSRDLMGNVNDWGEKTEPEGESRSKNIAATTSATPIKHKSRSTSKCSSSAVGLSLFIQSEEANQCMQSPGGSSTASSRDASPCQELSPLISQLKPPIIIRRGPNGFGFTVHTVRVYYGDTYFYTMHHLVMAVDAGSPAFEAGLRRGDLITHINGQVVQGLYHTQVLQLLLSGGEKVTLRATPLENTSIRNDGRKRQPNQGKLATSARRTSQQKHKKIHKKTCLSETRTKKNSSFASENEASPKSAYAITRPVVSKQSSNSPTPASKCGGPVTAALPMQIPSPSCLLRDFSTPEITGVMGCESPGSSFTRLATLSPELAAACPPDYSSNSSSSSSSNSPSPSSSSPSPNSCYQRPSSLHGLKHKLASNAKSLHSANRRKSIGHIPLSPLARTPSPSPLPVSPTRSPSPLIFPPGHHPPGSSNTTQSYSPSVSASSIVSVPSPNAKKSSFGGRTKTTEARSPLFRRALSPDRIYPRSVDIKNNVISPLCDPALKVTLQAPRITVTSKSPPQSTKDYSQNVSASGGGSSASDSVSALKSFEMISNITGGAAASSVAAFERANVSATFTEDSHSRVDVEQPRCEASVNDLPHIIEEKEVLQDKCKSVRDTNSREQN